MNKQYLKENGLYDAHKQFMRLCEWSYVPTSLEEEGEDQQQQQDPNAMGGADPMMGNQDPMGGADPNMGGDPNAMGEDPNAMGGADPMMGDPMMGDDMEMDGEEDDVIDVEDLTQSQEKVNDKVNHVGKDVSAIDNRINTLMTALDKMEGMINSTNKKIEDLNSEFKKRISTPTEKLNLRSLDSYPFNVKPDEYWSHLTKERPQYSVHDSNEMPPQKEYTITQSDIDNKNDKEIEDSFNVIDDEFRQDINKIFGI